MRKLTFCLLVILISIPRIFSEEIVVVEKGKLKDAFVLKRKNVRTNAKGYLTVFGKGAYIAPSQSLDPEKPFRIFARLSLPVKEGTAASLWLNHNNFGFDGAGGVLFTDGYTLGGKPVNAKNPIIPNTPFTAEITGDKEKLTLKINGNIIANSISIRSDFADQLVTALRPHRAEMRIYDFRVYGEVMAKTDYWDIAGACPPKAEKEMACYSIAEDAFVPVDLPDADWDATLSYAGETEKLSQEKASGHIRLNIPSTVLANAYDKADGSFVIKCLKLNLTGPDGQTREETLLLYDPKKCSGFRQHSVKMHNGAPAIFCDGTPAGIMRGRNGMMRNRYRPGDTKDFAKAKLDENIMIAQCEEFFVNGKFQQKYFQNYMKNIFLRMISDAPDTRLFINWCLYTSREWNSLHKNELIKTDPPVDSFHHPGWLQPSYASGEWRKMSLEILNETLDWLAKSPMADRMTGMKIGYGNCTEWNNFGYHDKAFPDQSPAMQKEFGKWLAKKYVTVDKLQKAWNKNDVTFESPNLVPGYKERMVEKDTIFRCYPKGRQATDFYQFWQEFTVETIEYLAKSVKENTGGKILIGAFYGYFIGHLHQAPYHFQDSGHYALSRFLHSPYLDFIASPYPYDRRRENAPINGAFSSVALNGKLWDSENDQRTHRSGPENIRYGTTDSLDESIAIAKRDFIQNLAKGGSYYFQDFVYGWYKDPEFMQTVATLKKIDNFALRNGRESAAEVAVLLDEDIIPRLSNKSKPAMDPLNRMLQFEFDSAGAPWDCYVDSDLEKIDFSKYKLVIMANSYGADKHKHELLKKRLYNNRRSVLYLYAPGIVTEDGSFSYEEASALTGLKFSKVSGIEEAKFSPFWIAEKKNNRRLKVISHFKNKTPSLVAKTFADHRIFYSSMPGLRAEKLHTIYKIAGVHRYAEPGDCFYACKNIVGIYSQTGGEKFLSLPAKVEMVFDFFSQKVLAVNTSKIKLTLPAGASATILYTGPKLKTTQQPR